MDFKNLAPVVNELYKQTVGKEVDVTDLGAVTGAFKELADLKGVATLSAEMLDTIVKIEFVTRAFTSNAPNILMDSEEFGSIYEKVSIDPLSWTENAARNLKDGVSYDPNVYKKPVIHTKILNQLATMSLDTFSIPTYQLNHMLRSGADLNSFHAMLEQTIHNSFTIATDGLIMATIANMIGTTVANAFADGTYTGKTSHRAVNLLYLYNQRFNQTLTPDKMTSTPEFLRFASYTIGAYCDRLKAPTKLFNVDGVVKFTPSDEQRLVLHTDFARAADVYLKSDTYHNELVALPSYDSVSHWQGVGTDFDFTNTSKINIKTADKKTVELDGILGVLFDRRAVGVTKYDYKINSQFNPKGDFTNYFPKMDYGNFNDTSENFVVFYGK